MITSKPTIMNPFQKKKSIVCLMTVHATRPGQRQFGYFAVLLFSAFAMALAFVVV
jgi:hypothetical protein